MVNNNFEPAIWTTHPQVAGLVLKPVTVNGWTSGLAGLRSPLEAIRDGGSIHYFVRKDTPKEKKGDRAMAQRSLRLVDIVEEQMTRFVTSAEPMMLHTATGLPLTILNGQIGIDNSPAAELLEIPNELSAKASTLLEVTRDTLLRYLVPSGNFRKVKFGKELKGNAGILIKGPRPLSPVFIEQVTTLGAIKRPLPAFLIPFDQGRVLLDQLSIPPFFNVLEQSVARQATNERLGEVYPDLGTALFLGFASLVTKSYPKEFALRD